MYSICGYSNAFVNSSEAYYIWLGLAFFDFVWRIQSGRGSDNKQTIDRNIAENGM